MTRRRALDWVLLVVLVSSWAVLFARGFSDGLRTGRGKLLVWIASAASDQRYPSVVRTQIAELEPGDLVEAVDGEGMRGASALRLYDRAMKHARATGATNLRVSRDSVSREVAIGLIPSRLWWMPFVSSTAMILASSLILVLAPSWWLARRLLLATWFFAAGAVAWETRGSPSGTALEATFAVLALAAGSTLTIWNAQDYARSARPVPKRLRFIPIVAGALYLASYAVRFHLPYTAALHDAVALGAIAWLCVAVLWTLTRAYLHAGALERRQIRWFVLGFYVTLVGSVASIALGLRGRADEARIVQGVCGLAIPAGIFISVVGYRWLDVDRLLSAAASYTILGLVVLGAALALAPRVAVAAGPAIGLDPLAVQWLMVMALAVAVVPAHQMVRPRVDRMLFHARHQRMLELDRLLDDVGGCESVDELVRMPAERVDALFEPESIVLYARVESAFDPVFVRGTERAEPLKTDSVLVRALERRARPLSVDWGELDPFDRAALETLGASLVVPTRGRDGIAAITCLGQKRSGDIYTGEEIARLAAISSRCSEVLLRLTAPPAAQAVESTSAQVFRREGEWWTIVSHGKQIRLLDMRGLHHLATLLREPSREFPAIALVHAASGLAVSKSPTGAELRVVRRLGDAGPVLDAQARAAYRERITALDEELEDAERCADLGRLERATEERELLLAELAATSRSARPGSDAERARVAVTKAIKLALEKIAVAHPELGAHLAATVRRGYVCAYEPDPRTARDWEV